MKKRFLKATAVLLVTVLAFTGCGKGNSGPKETTNTDATTVEKPFEISMMLELFSDQAPNLENEWFQYLTDNLDVKLDANFVPTLSYVDKITTYVASGDLPMVFTANNNVLKSASIIQALKSDGFWSLTDIIKNYPNLYNFVGEEAWENSKIDGQIYGIPRIRTLARNGFVIRKDWLDNLGLEMPETKDELMEVMRAFTEDDPDQNGKNDTYGLVTTYSSAGNRGWNGVQTFSVAFGGPNDYGYIDGKVTPDFATPEYIKSLNFIKEIYDKGYMNVDFAEPSVDRNTYFNQGSYGMVANVIDGVNEFQDKLSQVVPTADCQVLPVIREEGKDPLVNSTSGYNGIIMFNKYGNNAIKTEEDLKKVLEFYEAMCTEKYQDLITYGLEGVTYEEADGIKKLIVNDSGMTQLSVVAGDIGQILPVAPYVRKADDNDRTVALYDAIEDRKQYLVSNVVQGLKSETYSLLSSELDTIMMDAAIRYIIGDIDEDGYWKAYDSWLAQGGTDVLKEYQEQYELYKK